MAVILADTARYRPRVLRWLPLSLLLAAAACLEPNGPATTNTNSAQFATLEEKVRFLQRYVTFRRHYRSLDYHIIYRNNGGIVPGPSEWDITIVAEVPSAELPQWIAGLKASAGKPKGAVGPPPESVAGVSEWYGEPGKVVGVDRERNVVAYHVWAH